MPDPTYAEHAAVCVERDRANAQCEELVEQLRRANNQIVVLKEHEAEHLRLNGEHAKRVAEIAQLQAQLAEKQKQIDTMQDHPDVRAARIKTLTDELKKLQGKV